MKTTIGSWTINLSNDKERPFRTFTNSQETYITFGLTKIDFINKASMFDVICVNAREALGRKKEIVFANRNLKHDYSSERV